MKSFKQFISEARQTFVKGWTLKSKIHTSTTNYDDYHIKQVVNKPSKFGLNDRKILKILEDSYEDMSAPDPKAEAKSSLAALRRGVQDNNVYIEDYLKKKGYCMFVIDKAHGSVQGWDEKSCRLGAKALDDNYLPYERSGFKLFEVKPVKGRPKYITNKFDWYDWLAGKKKRKYVSPMAQFREEFITELFDKPYKWRKVGKIDVLKLDPAPRLVSYYFRTDDGRNITVDVGHVRTQKTYEHKAVIEFTDETNDFSFDLTGKGDSFRVMSTILDTIKDTIKTTHPDLINFSADKEEGDIRSKKATGRAKLYKTMVKRFASKLGYTSKDKDDGSSIVFDLISKK